MNSLLAHHGRSAVRFIKSLAAGGGDRLAAIGYADASSQWADRALVVGALKGTVGGQTAGDAASLVRPIGQDFTQLIMPLTALGQLKGLRRVPTNVRLLRGTAEASAYWVGEGQPAPLSALAFGTEALHTLKLSSVSLATRELLRAPGSQAEEIIGAALARSGIAGLDSAFLDPTNGGVADVRPASITHGGLTLASTGSTLAAIDDDLRAMVRMLSEAGSDLIGAQWILSARSAIFLSLLRGSGGNLAHPGITATGGRLAGLPAIVSGYMPTVGSPGATSIVLADPRKIAYADDGLTDFEVAEHASLEMLDNPTNSSSDGTATTMVSMFQTGCAAIKVTRHANWSAPVGAAVSLTDVMY